MIDEITLINNIEDQEIISFESAMDLNDNDCLTLVDCLKKRSNQAKIKKLNLSDNIITPVGANLLSEIITENFLTALDLSRNKIEGNIDQFSQALKKCSLQTLNLAYNSLKDDGVIAILKSLLSNTCLEKLDLTATKITDKAADWIAKLIIMNSSLRELALSRNEISDSGIKKIIMALESNKTLISLNLQFNHSPREGVLIKEENVNILKRNNEIQREIERLLQTNKTTACKVPSLQKICFLFYAKNSSAIHEVALPRELDEKKLLIDQTSSLKL